MDANQDKENIKVSTRIPLPVAPLPALPSHLLKKVTDRPPLNTLAGPNADNLPTSSHNTQSLAGPSTPKAKTKIIGNRPKSPFKLDTKFVTFRRGCGVSGLDYVAPEIGERGKSVPNVISISSDDEIDNRESESFFSDKELSHRKVSSATPAFQKLQPARVKNIKRSLKRPHSRELQGVSPMPNREKDEGDTVRRRLNFSQSIQERMQAPDFLQKSYMDIMNRQYTADIQTHLISIETKLAAPPRIKNETRACVINWLMKINGDGDPATIQMAIWYLDSTLSTGHVTLENMQLVAAASYWIATKIQGPVTSASKLVKYANNAFTAQRLFEAEKIILARLKYPQHAVVAQDYLCYFAWWCNKERPGELEVAATFLCLCGMMVNKNLCQEYPSVVAAASIRNALVLLGKKELMPRLQKCLTFVAAETKVTNISHTCSILRHAVRTVAAKDYSYNFIYEQYGTPPKYIAQTIVTAANELAVLDTRTTQAF